jgi:hypothetical protein
MSNAMLKNVVRQMLDIHAELYEQQDPYKIRRATQDLGELAVAINEIYKLGEL